MLDSLMMTSKNMGNLQSRVDFPTGYPDANIETDNTHTMLVFQRLIILLVLSVHELSRGFCLWRLHGRGRWLIFGMDWWGSIIFKSGMTQFRGGERDIPPGILTPFLPLREALRAPACTGDNAMQNSERLNSLAQKWKSDARVRRICFYLIECTMRDITCREIACASYRRKWAAEIWKICLARQRWTWKGEMIA